MFGGSGRTESHLTPRKYRKNNTLGTLFFVLLRRGPLRKPCFTRVANLRFHRFHFRRTLAVASSSIFEHFCDRYIPNANKIFHGEKTEQNTRPNFFLSLARGYIQRTNCGAHEYQRTNTSVPLHCILFAPRRPLRLLIFFLACHFTLHTVSSYPPSRCTLTCLTSSFRCRLHTLRLLTSSGDNFDQHNHTLHTNTCASHSQLHMTFTTQPPAAVDRSRLLLAYFCRCLPALILLPLTSSPLVKTTLLV